MAKPHLVLVHGYAETGYIFKHLITSLAEKYQVWVPELPGFGITEAPNNYSISAYAQWISAFMEENGIEKAHLAGHSLGGYILATFAVLFPEKIDRLSLIHSHAAADGEERIKKREDIINALSKYGKKPFLNLFYAGLFQPENVGDYKNPISEMFDLGMRIPDKTLIELQKSMQIRMNCVPYLSKMSFPIRFFAGKYDPLISVHEIEEQVNLIPRATIIVAETAHMGLFECPEILVEFLLY